MASKIYDEISAVTKYAWAPDQDTSANIIGLARSTDSMVDMDYEKFSPAAAAYLDAVAAAMQAKTDPPEFPDYVENVEPVAAEPKPDEAPRRRRREPTSTGTPPEDTPAETTEAPKAKKAAKRRSRKKAAATTKEAETTTEAAEPGSASPASAPKRGDKLCAMRRLSLENSKLTEAQFFQLLTVSGLDPSESVAVLVHYNTRHTLAVLKETGCYDHEANMAEHATKTWSFGADADLIATADS